VSTRPRFDAQPHLAGELLEVRPLRASDRDALYRAAADPLLWEQHPADRHERAVFDAFFDDQLASGGGLLVCDRVTGAAIGTSRYHAPDLAAGRVEIGWTFLARAYWGGRWNGELKRLMLAHAFRFVDTIVFVVHEDNHRSRRAVEKLGAAPDGERIDADGSRNLVYALQRPAPAR
jgi:RimJ/RimL family protein N-acetyltransferase